jgi:signal transduction histidine kinase
MSSIIHGRMRLELRPLDLSAVVRATVDMVGPGAGERRTSIVVRDGSPVWIDGDPARIRQIVWNLLTNATKFTAEGGRIEVGVEALGGQGLLTVTDNGEGIAAEFLPHVFDRFRQESETVTRQYSGLGIGLALARTLSEMHGGAISADSAGKGAGATFTVRLPLRAAGPGTAAPSPTDPPAADPK